MAAKTVFRSTRSEGGSRRGPMHMKSWLQPPRGRKPIVWSHRALSVIVMVLVGVLPVAACGSPPSHELIRSDPDLIGFIIGVEQGRHRNVRGTVIVESHADKLVRRYYVLVSVNAGVYERNGDRYRQTGLGAASLKQWAWVWLAEPAPDEFEATITATQIALIAD